MRSLRMRTRVALGAAVALTVGCGSGSNSASVTTQPQATTIASATPPGGSGSGTPVAKAADSSLGKIVVNVNGMTLYAFDSDTKDKSACTNGCTATWPPLTATGTPTGIGLTAGDFATITRDDGTQQVSLHGHPLYTYAPDAKPGDTKGQGKLGLWHVVGTDGNPVTTASSGASSTTSHSGY